MSPQAYCQEKAAAPGSALYYAVVFLPPDTRDTLVALHALHRELVEVATESSEAQVTQLKLGWWREELARTFDNRPQHPVSRALYPRLQPHGLALAPFLEMIDAIDADAERDLYRDYDELERFCNRSAGTLARLAARAAGSTEARALEYASSLGTALGLAELVSSAGQHAARGRLYLPRAALADYGVSVADVATDIRSGKVAPALKALLAAHARHARDRIETALGLPGADRYPQRWALVLAEVYRRTLARIERKPDAALYTRTSLAPIRKLWIAWSVDRRERSRRDSTP